MKITAALELALQLMQGGAQLAALITKARAEGRDELTEEEVHSLIVESDKATADLAAAIAAAKAKGQ